MERAGRYPVPCGYITYSGLFRRALVSAQFQVNSIWTVLTLLGTALSKGAV